MSYDEDEGMFPMATYADQPDFYNDNDSELLGAEYEAVLGALEDLDDDDLDALWDDDEAEDFEEMGFSLKKGFRKFKRKAKRTIKKELKPENIAKSALGIRSIEKQAGLLKRAAKSKAGRKVTKSIVKGKVRKAIRVGGKVGTSKYVRAGAAGVSLAFPPAAPAAGAVLAAGQALKTADGMLGSPKAQKAAKRAILNTVKNAKKGDKNARRMAGVLSKVQKAKKAAAKKGKLTKGILVLPGGRISRGNWRKG